MGIKILFDIIEDIRALEKLLEKIKGGASQEGAFVELDIDEVEKVDTDEVEKVDTKPSTKKTTKKATKKATKKEKKSDEELARELLSDVMKHETLGVAEAKKLLAGMDANRISDLTLDQLPKFISECRDKVDNARDEEI